MNEIKHLIINSGSTKTPQIADLLSKEGLDYTLIDLEKVTLDIFNSHDKIIISGAPILLHKEDPAPYIKLLSPLLELDKPVLGICFGHQMLGILEGGKVTLTQEKRDQEAIHQLIIDPLFEEIPQDAEFIEDHCESVSITDHFLLLADSESCFNEAMKHKTKPWYGVQFHPEVSTTNGHQLIKNWLYFCS
ncbi:C26 family cysteine hydrolase domain-containing family [Flammeovirga sp. MY04]|uniref:glutamine amidotransferase-related protein n=1 Tax=Flammeovirga sp. MY04 TaxID=1191459 RepID=UPI0008064331|nr:gamma-glutamyl-gamma-aminobutyrate hydrolase family protein [Flammeovirga sp. MY04]ANQ49297.1 C26 family cysteine hydrolase domain-containing family [Flammeovirga sp. MY04]